MSGWLGVTVGGGVGVKTILQLMDRWSALPHLAQTFLGAYMSRAQLLCLLIPTFQFLFFFLFFSLVLETLSIFSNSLEEDDLSLLSTFRFFSFGGVPSLKKFYVPPYFSFILWIVFLFGFSYSTDKYYESNPSWSMDNHYQNYLSTDNYLLMGSLVLVSFFKSF